MRVIAPIERRRCVRKDLVVGDVVVVDVVARGTADDWRAHAEVADQRRHRNIDHVVAEAAPVRPAAGHHASAESGLDLAGQHVSAEDAQTREPRVIGIDRIRCATAGETRRVRGQIHLDQIGDENSGDVRPVRRRGDVAVEARAR